MTERIPKSVIVVAAAENWGSYLFPTVGVGIVGEIHFSILRMVLIGKVVRTLIHMRTSEIPMHLAIPIAIVVVAGILHVAQTAVGGIVQTP